MSYQQYLMNNNNINRLNKNHYSNRQQKQYIENNQISSNISNKNNNNNNNNLISSSGSTGSSSETTDEQLQLSSSISTSTSTNKTISSQKAMLSHNNKTTPQQHQQQHHLMQQQQKQRQAQLHHLQQQQYRQQQQQQHHALQSHSLATPGKIAAVAAASAGGHHNNKHHQQISSADNMTTSSSSDHTIDDLHHLANGTYANTRLTGATAGVGNRNFLINNNNHSQTSSSSLPLEATINGGSSSNGFLFGVLFTLAQISLHAIVSFWLYWSLYLDDGLAWQNDRKQQFNTHAALMLIGFIYLNGQAILIYRWFPCCNKIYTKILHTILFVLATSAISLGLIIGYTAQENVGVNNKQIMHFYSLHAWIGLSTIGLFIFQFVFGFVSFLILLCCDSSTTKFRSALLPIHKTFGLIIFSLAISTCLTGLLQTARSRLSSKLNKVDYHELDTPGIIINLIGVCLICLSIIMPYIIRNLNIKRPYRPSELVDRRMKF